MQPEPDPKKPALAKSSLNLADLLKEAVCPENV
jgi:hypothetical protein